MTRLCLFFITSCFLLTGKSYARKRHQCPSKTISTEKLLKLGQKINKARHNVSSKLLLAEMYLISSTKTFVDVCEANIDSPALYWQGWSIKPKRQGTIFWDSEVVDKTMLKKGIALLEEIKRKEGLKNMLFMDSLKLGWAYEKLELYKDALQMYSNYGIEKDWLYKPNGYCRSHRCFPRLLILEALNCSLRIYKVQKDVENIERIKNKIILYEKKLMRMKP